MSDIEEMSTIEILEGVLELLELDNDEKLSLNNRFLIEDSILGAKCIDQAKNVTEYSKAYEVLDSNEAPEILKETIEQLKLIELLE